MTGTPGNPRGDLLRLAGCQALLLTNGAGFIAMNGLVGSSLSSTKALATLGATTYVLGSALATIPASLWMKKVGRRTGFMTGALFSVAGCCLAALALWVHSFPLYCAATAVIGVYGAIGQQYRFAAAEIVEPASRAKAISLVLAGGIVGGFIGPASTRWAQHAFATPFLGSFVVLAVVALAAFALQSQLRVPAPTQEERSGRGRPLAEVARQPVFVVAVLAAALGYGVMNLLMTATPLAMSACGHPYSAATLVIEWHVVGMYAPGFATGTLIKRLGALPMILIGVVLAASCAAVGVAGISATHFLIALGLLGVGWNFMYTGGTALLTEAYSPQEKAMSQGANDFIVFAVMALTSFASGVVVSTSGWNAMNLAALVPLSVVAVAAVWLALSQRRRTAKRSEVTDTSA